MRKIYFDFLIYYLFIIIYSYVFPNIFLNINNCINFFEDNEWHKTFSLLESLVFYFLGALLETLFASALVVYILEKIIYFKNNKKQLLIISAIPFALGHYHCIEYMIASYFVGIIFNKFYIDIKQYTKNIYIYPY